MSRWKARPIPISLGLGVLTLLLVFFYQACSPGLVFKVGPKSSLQGSGDGIIFSGMQSLVYIGLRDYVPTDNSIALGAQYFRLLPGNMCGGSTPSHAGSIVNDAGQLKYYPNQCVAAPQLIGSFPLSAYDPEYLIYQNGIFQFYTAAPNPATAPAYNKVFCRSGNGSEGFDVVIQKQMNAPAVGNLFSTTVLSAPEWRAWDYNAVVTPDSILAPDGVSASYKMTETTFNDVHTFGQSISSVADNEVFVFSVFVKSAGRYIALNVMGKDGTYYRCGFDLGNGVPRNCGNPFTNPSAAGLEPYPNGWYRVWVVDSVMAGTQSGAPMFYFELDHESNNSPYYAGDGVSGVYLADAKLERTTQPSPVSPMSAEIISGQKDPVSGQFKSQRVSAFEVHETLGSSSRSFGSNIFRFVLDINGLLIRTPTQARLQATIDQRPVDLNLTCWAED